MKQRLITLLSLVGLVIMAYGTKAQTQDSTAKKDVVVTIQIKTSAVCDMCKETLEKAMAYEKGVKDSNLDVDSKILTVKFDTRKTSAEKIKKAVTMTGYDADEMPADPKAYANLNPCCKKDYKH